MKRDELISGYVEWLSCFKWNFFGTLTFRRPDISTQRANQIFQQWIGEIKNDDGTTKFRWFRVTERGAFGDHLHFHVLVGGLRSGTRHYWVYRWQELAGDASISYYSRFGSAVRYVVKTARPGRDFEIDFDLPRKATSYK